MSVDRGGECGSFCLPTEYFLLYIKECEAITTKTGQVTYRSQTGQTLEKQGYQVTIPVSDQANLDQFVTILRNHQAGQTDFPTFCQETAEAGIYKWVIDLAAMTCSYLDKAEQAVFVETIPSVEN
ncbi:MULTISPECIES: DUF1398 family protein [Streptococcus]|uniref:DUF1398 family protein n=1 Tax=Streptococcus TaxID=1301 RepID=UPI0028BD9EDF|nr:DUF1398 family protein [Streptococcus sp. 2018037]